MSDDHTFDWRNDEIKLQLFIERSLAKVYLTGIFGPGNVPELLITPVQHCWRPLAKIFIRAVRAVDNQKNDTD